MWSEYASVESMPPGYRFDPTDEELIFYLRNKVLFRSVPGGTVKDIDDSELYGYPPHEIVEDPLRERGEWYFFIHHVKYLNKQKGEEKENIPIDGNWIGTSSNWKKEVFQKIKQNGNHWVGNDITEKQEHGKFRIVENGIVKDFKQELEKRKIQMTENRLVREDFEDEEQKKEKTRVVGNGIGFWKSVGKEDPIYDANGINFIASKIHFVYFSGSMRRSKRTHWRMEEYHLVTSRERGDGEDLKKEEWVLGRITRGRNYS